ncbi:hypothetical protein CLAFUW4_03770 [Fulvia fulva]|uniref:Uncharacterized protein n=1 Tax=Passalora fulva TaxID=5499 RepID=A0A9Q8L9Y1_PASFU|nr:uncharacterized protein CLAFUR5_03742 [Fulvia fulva]KAK4631098.1 hypothetical protein CLAFUR4_03758 [Fulvia fulva]UJO13481.1 hypothetical protein CLAFUR5_03742 [Fulvia fulva]WPV11841.1 hypothetical protein CLAFUW4_03770 [Fulvia fulva]WPV25627.1 hypothetical protein CLAFUW7_03762 [Fulvia fulva]
MDNSRLLSLPPELRNEIYRYVLVSDTRIIVSLGPTAEPPEISPKLKVKAKDALMPLADDLVHQEYDRSSIAARLALTSVCKQKRAESLPILLGENNFTMVIINGQYRPLIRMDTRLYFLLLRGWLSCLDGFAPCLKHITLDLGVRIEHRDPDAKPLLETLKGLKAVFRSFSCDSVVFTRIHLGQLPRGKDSRLHAQLGGSTKQKALDFLADAVEVVRDQLFERYANAEDDVLKKKGLSDPGALRKVEDNLFGWKAWVEAVLDKMDEDPLLRLKNE